MPNEKGTERDEREREREREGGREKGVDECGGIVPQQWTLRLTNTHACSSGSWIVARYLHVNVQKLYTKTLVLHSYMHMLNKQA